MLFFLILFFVALWAGAQNALAGGGSFLTLPALIAAGMDARAANITSTIALFPAQIVTGYTGRRGAEGLADLSLKSLFAISLVGGGLGGAILLATPASIFEKLVPWLVLFATAIFAWGSFVRRPADDQARRMPYWASASTQFLIAVYGGYFGGGIGFLMMAALTAAGQNVRIAGATKNILAGVVNAAAVAIFAFSPAAHWPQAFVTAIGASLGGFGGALMLQRVNEKALRIFVVAIGLALTVGLFLRSP